jgi:hypothetical protein
MPGMKGKRLVMSYRSRGWAIVGTLGTTLVLSATCGGETSPGSHQSPPVANSDFSKTLASALRVGPTRASFVTAVIRASPHQRWGNRATPIVRVELTATMAPALPRAQRVLARTTAQPV